MIGWIANLFNTKRFNGATHLVCPSLRRAKCVAGLIHITLTDYPHLLPPPSSCNIVKIIYIYSYYSRSYSLSPLKFSAHAVYIKVFLACDLASLRFHANVTWNQVSLFVLQVKQPSSLVFEFHYVLSRLTCPAA